jgi:hypothetical protein
VTKGDRRREREREGIVWIAREGLGQKRVGSDKAEKFMRGEGETT